ncbi:SprT-like domain-containing protein [Rhodanobacter sp. FW106-PBR-R2A-1-13]|uniref:SprT-like domain-containing protein n=1 Tax=Rhodanobacter sp. FW106-PBR-R2A-1-13 TaxID=3454845 RepID=UPI0034E3C158
MLQPTTPTEQAHHELAMAFDVLNQRLFDGELPSCLITLQRSRGFRGFFSANRFIRADAITTHEIAMNPQIFALATLPEVLSELAHSMTHLWAHLHGLQGRRGYHSKGWADRMEALGLMPSSTGRPGGKRTGEKVEHYIIEGGAFEAAVEALVSQGFKITWLDRVASPWLEDETATSAERERQLLGSQLLGRMGLLVSQGGEEDDELTDVPGGEKDAGRTDAAADREAAPRAPDDDAGFSWGSENHAPAQSYVLDDDEAPIAQPSFGSQPEQRGPSAADTTGMDSPVILESGSKLRAGEQPQPVPLISVGGHGNGSRAKPRKDKVRFTCPSCRLHAWAKGSACLDCGTCKVSMEPATDSAS